MVVLDARHIIARRIVDAVRYGFLWHRKPAPFVEHEMMLAIRANWMVATVAYVAALRSAVRFHKAVEPRCKRAIGFRRCGDE